MLWTHLSFKKVALAAVFKRRLKENKDKAERPIKTLLQ